MGDHAEADRDEEAAAAVVVEAAPDAWAQDRGGRHAEGARGDERVGDVANHVRAAEHVDDVGGLPREDRAAQQRPDAIDPPAGERDGADDRAEQDEVGGRVGEVGQLLGERRARGAVDRGRHRERGQHGGDGEAADDPVQPRRGQRVADALAGQDEQREVLAGVERQPERIGDRRDRDGVEIRLQRVDDVADGDQEQASAGRRGREAPVRAGHRVGHAGQPRGDEERVVDPPREEVRGGGAAETGAARGPRSRRAARCQRRPGSSGEARSTSPE
jgi:hypothetical protein